jgi:predicted nucleotidyltransferase
LAVQGKDAVDLALIMRRYLEAGNLDRLYADFAYVINENFDFEPTSAWLLGRDARAQLIDHALKLLGAFHRGLLGADVT